MAAFCCGTIRIYQELKHSTGLWPVYLTFPPLLLPKPTTCSSKKHQSLLFVIFCKPRSLRILTTIGYSHAGRRRGRIGKISWRWHHASEWVGVQWIASQEISKPGCSHLHRERWRKWVGTFLRPIFWVSKSCAHDSLSSLPAFPSILSDPGA